MNRRVLPIAFGVLIGVPFVLMVIGFFLPGSVYVERSVFVEASPSEVFSRLDSAEEWASYHRGERAMGPLEKFEITGLAEGPGSGIQYYVSNQLVATYTIRETVPSQRIDYGFSWEAAPVSGTGAFILESEAGGTRLIRKEHAQVGPDPVYRWLALTLEEAVGEDFEKFFDEFVREP